MPQPARTAGSGLPIMGGAMALSALLHGLALAAWVHAHHPAEWPMSMGQKRGSLSVRLMPVAPPVPAQKAAPAPQPRHPILASIDKAHARVVQPAHPAAPPVPRPPAPSPDHATADTAQAAPKQPSLTEPPMASADKPGARFANLFAPLISRPMGRGGWGRPPPDQAPVAQAAMQHEQAVQGARQAVQTRTEQLRAQLHEQPLSGACDVRIALDQQAAQVQCQSETDHNRVAAIFQSALNLVTTLPDAPSQICLHLADSQINWVPCTSTLPASP